MDNKIAKIFIVFTTFFNFSNTAQNHTVTVMPEAWYSTQSGTARLDNYILQYQRQFEQQLNDKDRHLQEFRNSYLLRLSVIEAYDPIVADKLKDIENSFYPLEMLNEVNDFCMEKYRNKIPVAYTVKTNLEECMRKANLALNTITKHPEDTLKNMHNHFNNNFLNGIKECKRKYEKIETKYHNCANSVIKSTEMYFITNFKNFFNQMSASTCMANTNFNDAFACYSMQIYSIFTALGNAKAIINNCMAGHDVCPPINSENLSAVKGRCPYHMAWYLEDDDLSGETIFNPFKGINKTTPCLQINFITNDFINDVELNK